MNYMSPSLIDVIHPNDSYIATRPLVVVTSIDGHEVCGDIVKYLLDKSLMKIVLSIDGGSLQSALKVNEFMTMEIFNDGKSMTSWSTPSGWLQRRTINAKPSGRYHVIFSARQADK